MVAVTRTFTVEPAIDAVVEYLKDFAHAEAWDPGTLSCVREDEGPIQVGSRWHNTSKFMGRTSELEYLLLQSDPDRLVFFGRNKSATSRDDLGFAPDGTGTRITYRADIVLRGLPKLASPFLRRPLERLADAVVAQMKDVIDSRA